MNAFDARYGFRVRAFKSLLERALPLLLRGLEVIKGGAITIAESLSALPAADPTDALPAANRICGKLSAWQARHSAGTAR